MLRAGDARAVRATLSERKDGTAAGGTRPAAARPSAIGRLGLAVEELSPRDAATLGLGDGGTAEGAAEEGALVIGRVEEGSPAARAGLAAGDAIRRVGRQSVRTLGEFAAADWPEPEKGFAAMIRTVDRDTGRVLDLLRADKMDIYLLTFLKMVKNIKLMNLFFLVH